MGSSAVLWQEDTAIWPGMLSWSTGRQSYTKHKEIVLYNTDRAEHTSVLRVKATKMSC